MYEILGYGLFCTVIFLSIILIYCFLYKPRQFSEVPYNSAIWAWNTSAVLNYENQCSPYIYAGAKKSFRNKPMYKRTLDRWWNITSREQLLDSIQRLSEGDMHHTSFCEDYPEIISEEEDEFDPVFKDWVRSNQEHVEKYGIIAWDLVRLQPLCGWGYLAGFLTYDEACVIAVDNAKKLQSIFSSWEEMNHN